MEGSAMSTTTHEIPDCEIRFAVGFNPRVIILRMNNKVLTTVSDGKYMGWSLRLVRQAFKREIFDAEDKGLWAAIVEGIVPAPIQLTGELRKSYARLMEAHARLKLSGINFEKWPFKRRPPLRSRLQLSLVRHATRPRFGQRTPAETFPVYRASIGDVYAIA